MFTEAALRHIQSTENRGRLEPADAFGRAGERGEGPYVYIWLRIADGRIVEASYESHGCPASMAAGGMICALARGRSHEQARLIEPRDVLLVLGGLPEGKEQFAGMAVAALRNALDQYAQQEKK